MGVVYEKESLTEPKCSDETELAVKQALSKHENPTQCPICKKMFKNDKGFFLEKILLVFLFVVDRYEDKCYSKENKQSFLLGKNRFMDFNSINQTKIIDVIYVKFGKHFNELNKVDRFKSRSFSVKELINLDKKKENVNSPKELNPRLPGV
ncbi:hypothetical protein BpHYR1_042149 [Brachionus plicatilis]|uniref:Uncharacterized protein n=1 Tax=Brachionus plicatilis TaxID=10195 RepID=A0A3M7PBV8_BRAPC|nr:hypothetical protein BpHYR1_042149 [Brachionus plicatilis]